MLIYFIMLEPIQISEQNENELSLKIAILNVHVI